MIRFFIFLSSLIVFNTVVAAAEVKLITQSPVQGSMIVGKLIGDGRVFYEDTELLISSQGKFVFGVGRDAPAKVYLTLKSNDEKRIEINILPREWKIERVDGLPPAKVNPRSPEVLKRIGIEAQLVSQARKSNTALDFFSGHFIQPAQGRISGVYGSQRILNGEPKRPHFGLDVANQVGTPIIAAASGIVSLVHKDMFYSGGTLIIDHGHGISSTYIHLDTISVGQGQKVKQGEVVATMGASGRATGPHLDWRLNWFATRLDPQLLLDSNIQP